MREMIKMVVVVTVLAAVSGGLLAALKDYTAAPIEQQQLQFVKGPAIEAIMAGSENDPVGDRFKVKDGDKERSVFVGVFDGQPTSVAFETSANGFAGPVGVMVGVNLADDKLIGIGVTTHTETPGLGARAQSDPAFAAGFKGYSLMEPFAVKNDGGNIDALSGATITSRGVCAAVTKASEVYKRLKPEMEKQAQAFAK